MHSTKLGRHFEISMKLCALLALESCAKGAQHHNKQKTTLHACKHLVMFALNLCRSLNFVFNEIMHITDSRKLCKECTTSQQAKNNSKCL